MKILVCISCVPDTTSKINFINNDTEFDKDGVQFVINPNDEFGLTRAIWFKEKNNSSVDVVSVGNQSIETVLRKTLAIGADKAIRINKNPKDSFETASYLSQYIKENPYDLIIAGRESIDYNGAMVPGMISEILNINFVTNCVNIEIDSDKAIIEREIEGGKEILSCELPLIVGGQKGIVEEEDLKIPNMRGIMQARKKPLEVIEPVDVIHKTTTVKFYKPETNKEIKMIDAQDLDKLIDLLHNEAKVL